MGLNPITHTAIRAWAALYKIRLAIWEISVLDALDVQFRIIHAEKGDPPGPTVQDAAQDEMDLRAAIAAKAERERGGPA